MAHSRYPLHGTCVPQGAPGTLGHREWAAIEKVHEKCACDRSQASRLPGKTSPQMPGTSHPATQLESWASEATLVLQMKALGPARSAEGPGTWHRWAAAGTDLKRKEALHRVGPVQAVETVHPQSAFLKT